MGGRRRRSTAYPASTAATTASAPSAKRTMTATATSRIAALSSSGPGAQAGEADAGAGEHLGDVGLDLRHGPDAGGDPLELQAQVAERRGRDELAVVQGVRVERHARLVVTGLRGGGGDRRGRGAREPAGDDQPDDREPEAHPPGADPVPGPPPRADRRDERPHHREEGDDALVDAEPGAARGRSRATRRPRRARRPPAGPPGAPGRPGRRVAPRTRATRRAARTTVWPRPCAPPTSPCATEGEARRRRGWRPQPAASRIRPGRRAGTRAHAVTTCASPVIRRAVVMIHRCGVPDAARALIDSARASKPPDCTAAAQVHPPTSASTATVALSTAVRGRPTPSAPATREPGWAPSACSTARSWARACAPP